MKFKLLVVASLSVLFAALSVSAQTADSWLSAHSKNFTIVGNASETDLRGEAKRLEEFRSAFAQIYPALKLADAKPTTILVFKDTGTFNTFLPRRLDGSADEGVTGYFLNGEQASYIALAIDAKKVDARSPIIHEFIHLVLEANLDRSSIPPWLNEGLAEYFDAARLEAGHTLVLGGENRQHIQLLRRVGLIPVSELLATDATGLRSMSLDRRRQFYAESWLLVRQLISDGRLKVGDLSQSIQKLKENNSLVSAAFGIDADGLQDELAKTLAQKSLQFTAAEIAAMPETEVAVSTVSAAHSEAIFGDLLFQMGEFTRAESFIKQAITADAKEPLANALMGLLLVNQNKFADAKPFLELAIAAGSTDYRVYFNYAFAISRDFTADGMIGEIPDGAAAEMRTALRRAIELAPGFVESYGLLALLEFVRDEDLDNASVLIRKGLEIRNDDADLKLLLARIMLRREDAISAKQLAEQVAATGDAKHKTEAGEIIKTAYEYTNARSAPNSENRLMLSVAQPQGVAVLKRSWLTDADVAQIEADRVNNNLNRLIIRPHPGEQQMVGYIERVTCVGSDINFYIRAGTNRLTLTSADFAGIRMTVAQEGESSYSIGCGAKLEKSLTIINYLPSLPGARAAGEITAISFVPDSFRLKSLQEMTGARMVAIDDDTLRRPGSPPVVVNDETIRKSIQDNLRKPRKGETRVIGQIENIECSGDSWVFRVFADGRHLKLVPPNDSAPSLGWFTVVSTQVSLTCGSGPIPGMAVFTFAPAGNADGELHSIEFVPDGFALASAGH